LSVAGEPGWTLFDSAIGRCAIAWSPHGVVGVQLPEGTDAETAGRIRRHVPRASRSEPPPAVAAAIAALQALVAGDRSGVSVLAEVSIDYGRLPDFERRAYEDLRRVPPGATTTYGEIARRLGESAAAQAVGQAMARNPMPLLVPCHRVLASDGTLGGFSGPGGVAQKRQLLEIEGAAAVAQRSLFGAG
jgi:methylated-DNA-[protein]-cysteine S-methyltransferase